MVLDADGKDRVPHRELCTSKGETINEIKAKLDELR